MSLREIVKSGRSVTISFVGRNIRGPVCDRSLVFVFVFDAIFEAPRESDENTMSVVLNSSNIVTKIVVQKNRQKDLGRSRQLRPRASRRRTTKIDQIVCARVVLRFLSRFWALNGANLPEAGDAPAPLPAPARASRGLTLHLSLGTSQPKIAARARARARGAPPVRRARRGLNKALLLCLAVNSARVHSDAFFVRNDALHGAGSHRHRLSAVHQHLLCS